MSLSNQICIVGCGPVGLLLATFLAKSPYIQSLALIDRKLPSKQPNPQKIPNQRVYSINKYNLNILDNLGVRSRIRGSGLMENIHVVSKQSQQSIDWNSNTAEVIENDELVRVLRKNLQEKHSEKVHFIEGQLKRFQTVQKQCKIQLLNGSTISASLLVGSDGNESKVKQLAKIPTYGWSHRQRAIVCTLQLDPEKSQRNQSAYQIYYEGNVLAVLPLWQNYCSIVWSVKIPEYDYLMSQKQQNFLMILNQVLRNGGMFSNYKFPHLKKIVNKRLAFPLNSLQADRYTGQRIALIGDASHSIHPMAGMGVNAGFYDAIFLANNIIKNRKTGNDIGTQIALAGFQTQSKKLNYSNSIAMQVIKKAFEIDERVINYGRKLGMQAMGSQAVRSELRKAAQSHPLGQVSEFEWETM